MVEISEDHTHPLCSVGAFILCIMHLLSVTALDRIGWHNQELNFLLVDFGVWLSPILVVYLSHRVCLLVLLCALPISAVFLWRLYWAWERYAFGTSSLGQYGDWSAWFMTGMGMISICAVGVWLVVWLLVWIDRLRSS